MVRAALFGAVLFIGLAIYPASEGLAQHCEDYWTAQYKCMEGCGPCGGAASLPAGPTQEQLKQRAEAKDLNDAAQDADDKGVAAYQRGDFAGAVRYLREAASDAPDDADIQHNLQRAQQKMAESEAARQAVSTEEHSTIAAPLSNEPASEEGRKGFDTSGGPASALQGPAVYAPAGGRGDPVVPASKRTQQITDLERQRTEARKNIAALEVERKTLDPKADAVKMSEIKQEESKAKHKVHYLNLSITAGLRKSQAASGSAPSQ